MNRVFRGSTAVAVGEVTRHNLSRWYRTLYRDSYIDKATQPTLADRASGAILWSAGGAIVTGAVASALHGARWVDGDEPVELIWRSSRPHPGLVVRNERIGDDEIVEINGLRLASPTRVAFDLGRHLPVGKAVARLDALANATDFDAHAVIALADRYKGARGVRNLRSVLALIDAGAQSPKETWLRLLFRREGLPLPVTRIPVDDDGYIVAYLDSAGPSTWLRSNTTEITTGGTGASTPWTFAGARCSRNSAGP